MRPVGGFFELELALAAGSPYHPDALALCSGRACLARILSEIRPTACYAPFFVCDSVWRPLEALGVPLGRYPLTEALAPVLPGRLERGACVLTVNYFGLMADAATEAIGRYADAQVVIDDTQAFFRRAYPRAWSFNSARKFFGVPDGGYAYGPGLAADEQHPPAREIRYDHLVNRWLGHQELAYQQYRDSEAAVCEDVRAMSLLSQRLLAGVDYEDARRRRRANFAFVHRMLGSANRLRLPLSLTGDEVPFCYPLLPETTVDKPVLWASGLFVPVLWPEVCDRRDAGFEFERDLAARLLPLPIDQRYGPAEMEWMCRLVRGTL